MNQSSAALLAIVLTVTNSIASADDAVSSVMCSKPISNLVVKAPTCEATLCKDQGLISKWKHGSAEDNAKYVNSAYVKVATKVLVDSGCFVVTNETASGQPVDVSELEAMPKFASTIKSFETDSTGISLSAGTLLALATGSTALLFKKVPSPSAELKVGSAKLETGIDVTNSNGVVSHYGDYSADISKFNASMDVSFDALLVGGELEVLGGNAKAKAFVLAVQDVVNKFIKDYKGAGIQSEVTSSHF